MPADLPAWAAQLHWLFLLLFLAMMIMACVGIAKWLHYLNISLRRQSAVEILKQRYVRGEIGRHEYRQKRAELAVHLGSTPPVRTFGHPLRKRSVVSGRDHERRRSSAHSPPQLALSHRAQPR